MGNLTYSSGSEPNDWTMGLSYGDIRAEYRWREAFNNGNPMGYYGFLVDPETGASFSDESRNRWISGGLKSAAISFRRAELRASLNVNHPDFYRPEYVKERILEIFGRAEAGEFMGQYSNQNIYVQDVAEIFDKSFGSIRDLVDELVAEGKLGLHGMILIPNKDYEAGFAHWEKQTGHRRLSVGDFGNWGCAACGRWGDEYESPSDVPCERKIEEPSAEDEKPGVNP